MKGARHKEKYLAVTFIRELNKNVLETAQGTVVAKGQASNKVTWWAETLGYMSMFQEENV